MGLYYIAGAAAVENRNGLYRRLFSIAHLIPYPHRVFFLFSRLYYGG